MVNEAGDKGIGRNKLYLKEKDKNVAAFLCLLLKDRLFFK